MLNQILTSVLIINQLTSWKVIILQTNILGSGWQFIDVIQTKRYLRMALWKIENAHLVKNKTNISRKLSYLWQLKTNNLLSRKQIIIKHQTKTFWLQSMKFIILFKIKFHLLNWMKLFWSKVKSSSMMIWVVLWIHHLILKLFNIQFEQWKWLKGQ